MAVRLGALVLFTSSLEATVDFYRAMGIDLTEENHGDGVLYFAAELDGCHFAVFPASGISTSPGLGEPGCSFAGIAVHSVHAILEHVRSLGAPVLEEPTQYPWGIRAVVADPDGRPVEIFEAPSD